MNYYEELGVAESASAEEIHEAYRTLARLLHPDTQQDESLRRAAERQMGRLNAIHAVLSDPAKRRRYDAGLQAAAPSPDPWNPRSTRQAPAGGGGGVSTIAAWVLAGVMSATSIYLYSTGRQTTQGAAAPAQYGGQAGNRPHGPDERETPPDPLPRRDAGRKAGEDRLRRRIERLRREGEAAPAHAEPPAETTVPPPAGAGSLLIPEPGSIAAIPPSAGLRSVLEGGGEAAPPSHPASARPRFAGRWFYLRPSKRPERTRLYPPEYIEAVVVQEGVRIEGRYRARYSVPDRPISPEVRFQFRGESDGEDARLRWTGPDGAEGTVELKLLSPDTMEVSWVATGTGRSLGLASGTAVLIRQRDEH